MAQAKEEVRNQGRSAEHLTNDTQTSTPEDGKEATTLGPTAGSWHTRIPVRRRRSDAKHRWPAACSLGTRCQVGACRRELERSLGSPAQAHARPSARLDAGRAIREGRSHYKHGRQKALRTLLASEADRSAGNGGTLEPKDEGGGLLSGETSSGEGHLLWLHCQTKARSLRHLLELSK